MWKTWKSQFPRAAEAAAPLNWNDGWGGGLAGQLLSGGHAAAERAPAAPASLEGPVAAGSPGNLYTFTLSDPGNLISSAIEAQITTDAQYVIGLISRYLSWQGTLDFVVEIRPAAQSPFTGIDGILPSVGQIGWNGSAWVNQTLAECLTGIDADPTHADAGCTIYLAADGTIRNYGSPVWFDPNPRFDTNAAVPSGMHDFVGIYTHEVFHSLGFWASTIDWKLHSTNEDRISWFSGPGTNALLGGRLPFNFETDHYGVTGNAVVPERGLMYQFGNYGLNRLDIGRIDLAVLHDLGHAIKSYDGLPLFELIDGQPDLTGTAASNALFGDYHANILAGLAGNDLIEAGAGDDRLVGGGGWDRMTGGSGSDLFAFTDAGDSPLSAIRSDGKKYVPDLIRDFTHGEDRIDLGAIDAIAGTPANDAFTFIGTAAFGHHAGELRYELQGGYAHIFADVNGDGYADMQIVVTAPTLLAADFVL